MIRVLSASLLAFTVLLFNTAGAEESAGHGKPFAEAHIVLQLGEDDPKEQARILNIANNLVKHYGDPELVALEIVTYDAGISLLYPDNPNADRISSLVVNQVKFVVCMNTVETLTRVKGEKPDIIPAAIPVKTGVAHLVERAKQGYIVIRP